MAIYPLAEFEVVSILFWSVVVIGLVFASFVGIRLLNKWMKEDETAGIGAGFTLSDLRQMVKSGQMSTEEFEKARAILLASVEKPGAQSGEGPNSAKPTNPTPPDIKDQ